MLISARHQAQHHHTKQHLDLTSEVVHSTGIKGEPKRVLLTPIAAKPTTLHARRYDTKLDRHTGIICHYIHSHTAPRWMIFQCTYFKRNTRYTLAWSAIWNHFYDQMSVTAHCPPPAPLHPPTQALMCHIIVQITMSIELYGYIKLQITFIGLPFN